MEGFMTIVLLLGFIFLIIPQRKDVYGKIVSFKEKKMPVYAPSSTRSESSEPLSVVVTGFVPTYYIRVQNPITHEKIQ